jgi:hypothetical protein
VGFVGMNALAAHQVLWGALAMACWVAGLFFLRFWKVSRDRLFLFFMVSFWCLGLNWLWLGLSNSTLETRHYAYLLRLVAFALLIVGIVDKNRRGTSS